MKEARKLFSAVCRSSPATRLSTARNPLEVSISRSTAATTVTEHRKDSHVI
jgi:hypothetical protein